MKTKGYIKQCMLLLVFLSVVHALKAQSFNTEIKEPLESAYSQGKNLALKEILQQTEAFKDSIREIQLRSCVSSFTNQTVSSNVLVEGCTTLLVQGIAVANGGVLNLTAPGLITINGAFNVNLGGALNVNLTSPSVNPQGNTMLTAINIGTFGTTFQYSDIQNTTNFTNEYGRSTNDVFYQFTITTPMNVTIKHCDSSVGDTYLYLLNQSGTLIAYNDDYSGSGACGNTMLSYLQQYLQAGTYYVVSEGYSTNGDIKTWVIGETPSLSGNTMQTAINVGTFGVPFQYSDTQNTAVGFTNDYVGQPANDVFYKFTITTPMNITIKHCDSSVNDTYLHLLDQSGNRIAYNDDYSGAEACGNTYHSYLKQELQAGTYYVVSEGYSANGAIKTWITGEMTSPPGNTMQTAINIGTFGVPFQYSDTQNTAVGFTNDYVGQPANDVFYKFTITTPMNITIKHCDSSVNDTYLHLLDQSGTRIAYNDDYSGAGACSNNLLSYLKQELQAGTYYVVSEGYNTNGTIKTWVTGELPQLIFNYNYDASGNRTGRTFTP